MKLTISDSREGNTITLRLAGELDVYTSPRLKQEIVDRLTCPKCADCDLALDLDGITYFDSCGAGVLIGGLKRARLKERELKITQASTYVRLWLHQANLSHTFGL